jgi:hypothetical protein
LSQRIAVVAVHGVGSPPPGEMARGVAGLLQRANEGRYSAFAEATLELDVAALTDDSPPSARAFREADEPADNAAPWYVRSRFARKHAAAARPTAEEDAPAGEARLRAESAEPDANALFTREAFVNVRLDDEESRSYRTVRLSGTRTVGREVAAVDVYEMHWAGLSRIGGWLGNLLGEFYQILFHLASIGQKTVELAWVKSAGKNRAFLTPVLAAQTVVESMLSAVLPVFILALLLAVLPVFAQFLPPAADLVLLTLALAGALWWLAVSLLWRFGHMDSLRERRAAWRALWLFLSFVAAAGISFVASRAVTAQGEEAARYTLITELQLAAFAAFVWCVAKLYARKLGHGGRVVLGAAVLSGLAWVALYLYGFYLWRPEGFAPNPVQRTMLMGEGLFVLIAVAWAVFIASAWATALAGFTAALFTRSWRNRAAIWTGKIAIFVPASLFFVVNLVGFQLLAGQVVKLKDADSAYTSMFADSRWLPVDGLDCRNAPADKTTNVTTVRTCVEELLAISAGPGFNAFMLVILVAMVLLVLALLPSIIAESSPEEGLDPGDSARLGTWLDAGLALARASGYILLGGLLIVLPGMQIADYLVWYGVIPQKDTLAAFTGSSLLGLMGGVILSSAGLLVLLRDVLFKGLTRAIGIAFDVDNWLKEAPIASNPRGRITRRYLALLRHICRQDYRRVVIVSHSQGTVISVDLLRFLKRFPDPEVDTPIRLMTFGSPIRQLYGRRFPHLYAWARGNAINTEAPNMYELHRVEAWVNGYRSGDYIGRFLWTEHAQWRPSPAPAATRFVSEFCVGAGAHTHYFDSTALSVGRAIDAQIA